MKKLLLLILSAILAMSVFCTVGCSDGTPDNSSISSETPTEKTYTVTFKQDGQRDVVKTVEEGESLTDIPEPKAKVGYTVAWEVVDLTNIVEDIEVKAIETANTYVVSYDLNGATGEISDLEVTFDGAYVLATPSRDGYSFIGWTYQGTAVLTSGAQWKTASNVTLVATWVKDVVNTYSITFKQNGVADKVYPNVEEGSAFTATPSTEAKVGYTVTWNPSDLAKLANVRENVIVNAVETANTYTITYDAGEGTVSPTTQDVVYDSTPTFAEPTRDGYTFTGWNYEGKAVSGKWTIADNVTLVATWTKNLEKFSVTFRQDGKTDKVFEDILEGSAFAAIPETEAKVGYTVTWNDGDLAKLQSVTENVVVNAVETANTYTITYDAGEGTVTPATQTVVYDSTPTLAIPEREGYTFTGWSYNGKAVSGKWLIADNVTIVATWLKDVVPTYTVTFRQAGQADKVYNNVEKGSTFTDIPAVVAKTGYVIAWNAEELKALTNISGNVVVTADEKAKTYTVTLNADGGSVSQTSITVTYGENYELPTPTKEGYEFLGWKKGSVAVDAKGAWTIDEDNVTLKATWKEIKPDDENDDKYWTDNY